MRSVLIDELLREEIAAARDYLNRKALFSGVEDLYWIPLPKNLWNETQAAAHTDEQEKCEAQSFRFAVEVGGDWVRFEMLVRSEGLRNLGGGQADEAQALFLFRWADDLAKAISNRSYQ